MLITTPTCIHCGNTSQVDLTDAEVAALQSGALIQRALPHRDAAFRELLITGIHPACWDEIFDDGEG